MLDQDQSNHEYTYAETNKAETHIAGPDLDNVYQDLQDVQDKPEGYSYAYADVKTAPSDDGLVLSYAQAQSKHGGEPSEHQEGWADNVIYATGNDEENGTVMDLSEAKKEGWVDNSIYAITEN